MSTMKSVVRVLISKTLWLKLFTVVAVFQVFKMITSEVNSRSSPTKLSTNITSTCKLPNYDYWHPDVMQFVDYTANPLATCDKHFKPLTQLANGEWKIVEPREGVECKARCIQGTQVKYVLVGDWMAPGKVDCEFLEAVCWEGSNEVYGYIHTQIKPKKTQEKPKDSENPPNVFVVLFDSMDTGRAKRSLNRTLSLLKTKFDAVEFPFVNKVGENSMPNGIALWLGKLIEPVIRSPFGGEDIEPDWNRTEYCRSYIKKDLSIFHDFQKNGYVTLNIDDYANQMISYPDCEGFDKDAFDHDMHPFYMTYELSGKNITKHHLKGHLCREEHHPAFEYFQQFLDAYKDRPKFSWMWLSCIGHDQFNGIIRADAPLAELIEKNADLIDDSFFILMGDHGMRLGYKNYQQTEIAQTERRNPYLSISIPKKLRQSDATILATMRENARRLQSHFDTRATLLDIAHFQPADSFGNRTFLSIRGEKGHSYLRRQPETVRTCGTLPIPPEHCICQVDKVPETDEHLKSMLGEKVLESIHEQLDAAHLQSYCERFELADVTSLLHFGITDHHSVVKGFEITLVTTAPSRAQFQTIVLKEYGNIIVGSIARLDTYGRSGECVKQLDGKLEQFCYCKNQSAVLSSRSIAQ